MIEDDSFLPIDIDPYSAHVRYYPERTWPSVTATTPLFSTRTGNKDILVCASYRSVREALATIPPQMGIGFEPRSPDATGIMWRVSKDDHLRLSRIVDTALLASMPLWRPRLEVITAATVSALMKGTATLPDITRNYALRALCALVGIRAAPSLGEWSYYVTDSLGPSVLKAPKTVNIERLVGPMALASSGLGKALWASEQSGELTADEVRSILLGDMLGIGIHTVSTALCWALYLFAQSPLEWTRLRAHHTEWTYTAIGELMRMSSPFRYIYRHVPDTGACLMGHDLAPGTRVCCVVFAANTDTRQWSSTARRLDIARSGVAQGHIGFNAVMAGRMREPLRLIVQMLLLALIARGVTFKTSGKAAHGNHSTVRSFRSVTMQFS